MSITQYCVQRQDVFGNYETQMTYSTYELAQNAMVFFLADNPCNRGHRIIKRTWEVLEEIPCN